MLVFVLFLCWLLNVGETFVRLFGGKLLSHHCLWRLKEKECKDWQWLRICHPEGPSLHLHSRLWRKLLGFSASFQGAGSSVGELKKGSAGRAVPLPFNLRNLRLIAFQPR